MCPHLSANYVLGCPSNMAQVSVWAGNLHTLLSRMDQAGIPYKIATSCNQIETCHVLANQGFGISFCTEATISHYHCENVVYLPMEEFPKRSVYLAYKRDPKYHPVLRSFVKFICGYYPGG